MSTRASGVEFTRLCHGGADDSAAALKRVWAARWGGGNWWRVGLDHVWVALPKDMLEFYQEKLGQQNVRLKPLTWSKKEVWTTKNMGFNNPRHGQTLMKGRVLAKWVSCKFFRTLMERADIITSHSPPLALLPGWKRKPLVERVQESHQERFCRDEV